MYTLVRRYLKTALAFLTVGLAIGGYLIARRELWGQRRTNISECSYARAVRRLRDDDDHGRCTVALPRPEKSATQYSPRLVATAYWVITIGTAARVGGEIMRSTLFDMNISALWLRISIVGAGFLQAIAIGVFFFTMWTRIRPMGRGA